MRHLEPKQKPARSDWHRSDIVAAIWKRGSTLRKLSIAHGYDPNVLKHALAKPYPKGEAKIAAFIGVAPSEIWPSRYGPDGTPNRKRRSKAPRRNTEKASVHGASRPGNGRTGGRA